MQGIIDATCSACEQVIQWDTAFPRRCRSCSAALLQNSLPTASEHPDGQRDEPETVLEVV
jgi:hypothetical protein